VATTREPQLQDDVRLEAKMRGHSLAYDGLTPNALHRWRCVNPSCAADQLIRYVGGRCTGTALERACGPRRDARR
jgi:hypothetical protein